MKPKDLKPPFSRGREKVLLDENRKVFFVPPRVEGPDFRLDFRTLFGNDHPVHVEYCSGNGDWICQKASACPDMNWIAVEKQFSRVRKIWSKMKNNGIENLFICCGEALTVTDRYFPDESIEGTYINFPDPWPKNKHRKFRLISSLFVASLGRILKPNGFSCLLTDHPEYARESIDLFLRSGSFTPSFEYPHYTDPDENYGSSYFFNLWKEKKSSFHYARFKKIAGK